MKKKIDWVLVAIGAATLLDVIPGDELIGIPLLIEGLGYKF